jgi:7-keto-8-aminopelargonate synthetase-like enzyme
MSSSKNPDIVIIRGVYFVRVSDQGSLCTLRDIHAVIARVGLLMYDDDDRSANALGAGGRAVMEEHHARVRLEQMMVATAEIQFKDGGATTSPPWVTGQA